MKKFNQVSRDLDKITAVIKADENKIKELDNIDQRRAALVAGDREKYEALKAEFNATEEARKDLSEKIYINKIARCYIADNRKVALYNDTITVIKAVYTKYNGKPYGEKTRDKIREEIKKLTGCSVWIAAREVNIYSFSAKGYKDCEVRAIAEYNNPILTPENKINAAALDHLTLHINYTENPKKAARDLAKLHKKTYAAIEAANKALNDYTHAAPGNIKNALSTNYIINPLYSKINIR